MPEPLDDEAALLARLRARDEHAFEELVRALEGRLRRLARGMVGAAHADDVVQDTWAAVWQALPRFEARASLRTWVTRILANTAITRLRRQGRESAAGDLGNDEDLAALAASRFGTDGEWRAPPHTWHAETPEALATAAELRACLQRALDALPPQQRMAVALRDLAGLPLGEVCNALGVSAINARVLLHRGRVKVWAAVEAYQSGDGRGDRV
jgi:RNA polymerase sigma-70 factor, ECF subfamily